MKAYLDKVFYANIAALATAYDPDTLAGMARSRVHDRVLATEFSLASIRARGNWIQINSEWHDRKPYLCRAGEPLHA